MLKIILLAGLAQAQAHSCLPEYPGPTGGHWSWQMVDGRKCWYNGPNRAPRARLYWPSEPLRIDVPLEPEAESEFRARWRGEPPK